MDVRLEIHGILSHRRKQNKHNTASSSFNCSLHCHVLSLFGIPLFGDFILVPFPRVSIMFRGCGENRKRVLAAL